jgi:hypothetical protein
MSDQDAADELGWGEAVGLRFIVRRGAPAVYIDTSLGSRQKIAFTFYPHSIYFLALISDDPNKIQPSPGEFVRMLERRAVPIGLFVSYLGEDDNLFPLYNWYSRLQKVRRFSITATLMFEPGKIISLRTVYQPFEETHMRHMNYLEANYRERLSRFTETDDSCLELEMVGPSHLVSEDEWMHAWRGLRSQP